MLLADRGYDADWLLAARGGMICSSVPVIRYSDKGWRIWSVVGLEI